MEDDSMPSNRYETSTTTPTSVARSAAEVVFLDWGLWVATCRGKLPAKFDNYLTVMMGWPKKEESLARVEIVKLCSPLSHLVISLGRFPMAWANCFFDNPLSCIKASRRLEI